MVLWILSIRRAPKRVNPKSSKVTEVCALVQWCVLHGVATLPQRLRFLVLACARHLISEHCFAGTIALQHCIAALHLSADKQDSAPCQGKL